MYKITWDKETGGVLLHSRIVEGTLGISPRPVFFEELDLLGLDKLGWIYPHVEEPIMWAVNKPVSYTHLIPTLSSQAKASCQTCRGQTHIHSQQNKHQRKTCLLYTSIGDGNRDCRSSI